MLTGKTTQPKTSKMSMILIVDNFAIIYEQ